MFALIATSVYAFKEMDAADVQEMAIIDEVGKAPCVFKVDDSFYDFTPLKLIDSSPTVPYFDGEPIPKTLTKQFEFTFGWCQHLSDTDSEYCSTQNIFAGRLDEGASADTECMAYSGGSYDDILTESITGQPMTKNRLQGQVDTTLNGIKLTYTNGQKCEATGTPTRFSLNMYCDPDMGQTDYDISLGVLGNLCEPYIDTVSNAACSRLSVSELWEYLAQYSEYFGVFLLISGFLLTLVGRRLLKPAVCCAGFLTSILVACFIFYAVYLEDTSQVADFWYFLGGGAAVGIAVGLLMCWAIRIGAAVLAGWGGMCGGLILYEMFIYRADAPWLFWVTVVLCAGGAAVATFFWLDQLVITSTVLLGSYCLVRGVACYAGHYYNEVTMAEMAKQGLLDEIDPWYWMYIGGFFVAVVIGMLVQCKSWKKELAKKERK